MFAIIHNPHDKSVYVSLSECVCLEKEWSIAREVVKIKGIEFTKSRFGREMYIILASQNIIHIRYCIIMFFNIKYYVCWSPRKMMRMIYGVGMWWACVVYMCGYKTSKWIEIWMMQTKWKPGYDFKLWINIDLFHFFLFVFSTKNRICMFDEAFNFITTLADG